MRRADLAMGVVVAAVGAYALSLALDLSLFSKTHVPGPGFFPTLLSTLLLALGLLLAVTSVRRRPDPDSTGGLLDPGPGRPAMVRREARAGTVWLIYCLSAPLLTVLGFVPATAFLVFVLLFAVEGRRNWRALLASILIPVATSALFVDVLVIPLPQGLISHGPFGI